MSGKTIYNCKLHDQSPTFFLESQISDSFFLAKVKHCWVKLNVFNKHVLISRLVFIHISLFYS